jgi:diguanylate cyclase (GGDEF)-like protein
MANQVSMRVSLIVTVVVVGMLAMIVALASGEIFRDFAVETRRGAVVEQLKFSVNNLRREFERHSVTLVSVIRKNPVFREPFEKNNAALAHQHLLRLLDHPAASGNPAIVINLSLYDQDLTLISDASREGYKKIDLQICRNFLKSAQRNRAGDSAQGNSGICVTDGTPFFVTAYSYGESDRKGYIQIVSDYAIAISELESAMSLPLLLTRGDETVFYKSSAWPRPTAKSAPLVADYKLKATDSSGGTFLNMSTAVAMDDFNKQLASIKNLFLLLAVAITVIAVFIAVSVLEKTAIKPLQLLTQQLRRLRYDESRLGEQVDVSGNAEIVELAAGFNEMTTRLKELYASLEHMAFTDPLTSLPNRTLFQDRLQQAIFNARRDYKPFALFLMDLDHFKDINDTLGHHVGDELLQEVAERLRGKLRESDTVARLGGDEFALLLPTVDFKQADTAARMLLQSLRAPFELDNQSLHIGASVGIALYPDHGVEANILVQRADVAMYAAKNSNIGYAFYDQEMDQNNSTRLALLGDLRRAVDQEQFELYYQPKVNLRTNEPFGLEALVRWKHPNGNLMLPDTFIPLLEHNGLIRSLTPWVVNAALQQIQKLHARGYFASISVNLSVRDLQDPYLADAIAEQLAAYKTEPKWLELEITESAVMSEPARAMDMLMRLSKMGLKLAIDDFGTGYSSLAYLKKLPVKTVKIDKSFVMGMARDDNDAAIVRTSIELAKNLGLDVIAEGVDSEDALRMLMGFDCPGAQGVFISRPLSENELEEWYAKSAWGKGPLKRMDLPLQPQVRPRALK